MKRTTVFLDQGEFMGGAEHFLLDFLASLNASDLRRINPFIFGGQTPQYQNRLPAAVPRLGFCLPGVKGGRFLQILALWKLFWTAKKLKNALKKHQATQIFTNTPRAHLTVLMLKKIWGWQGKWVVMMHDFTTRPTILVKAIGAEAEVLIANSLPTRTWLKQALKAPHHTKLRLIENGVATNKTVLPATQLSTVLNLGRIDPRKGQLYLAEAADLLQDRNPDLSFCITGQSVSADPNTTTYETQLKQFCVDRKLANLKFKPSVSEPLKAIGECDGLVFTPTEAETFGRVVIEALCCGKLVIAFNQTGPKEILQHYQRWLQQKKALDPSTENLLLVESNNAMSLAERIAYFADNPGEVEKYTAHAAEFVQQNYSLEETKKRLLEVLLG